MSLPCWNVVCWSKRGLAQELPSSGTFPVFNKDSGFDMPDEQSSSLFPRLPGELRTKILELCIDDSRLCPRCRQHHDIVADVSRNMQIRGIGPLPLLFASRQIHNELVSLVYSRLEPVAINGYFLIFQERPTSFLPHAYPAIWPRHPHVQTFARKVTITMAYWKYWGEGSGSWCDFTSDRQPPSRSSADTHFETNRSVIRNLAKYLRTFQSVSELELIIEVRRNPGEENEIHGLQQLLPLYDLFVPNTIIRFDIKYGLLLCRGRQDMFTVEDQDRAREFVLDWMRAWSEYLAATQRQIPQFEGVVERSGEKLLRFVATGITKFTAK